MRWNVKGEVDCAQLNRTLSKEIAIVEQVFQEFDSLLGTSAVVKFKDIAFTVNHIDEIVIT